LLEIILLAMFDPQNKPKQNRHVQLLRCLISLINLLIKLFQGFAVGNSVTDDDVMANAYPYFAWARGLFGSE